VLQHPGVAAVVVSVDGPWCGVAATASPMSNISTFFPKRLQGTGLGLNAGS
jgi:NNP family nitrate/nitrite transporter-like MFS transporter